MVVMFKNFFLTNSEPFYSFLTVYIFYKHALSIDKHYTKQHLLVDELVKLTKSDDVVELMDSDDESNKKTIAI